MDGDPDPGEVVWTWVPFEEDPTLGKDRPVVVIGRHGDHLSGVALTSKQHRDTVEVGTGAWDSKGRPSYAKVDRLLDIDPATVRREGAVLGRRRFDAVIDAVGKLHDIARLTRHARAPASSAAGSRPMPVATLSAVDSARDLRRAVLLGMTATAVRDAPR